MHQEWVALILGLLLLNLALTGRPLPVRSG